MATEQQLKQQFLAADAAGDVESAEIFLKMLRAGNFDGGETAPAAAAPAPQFDDGMGAIQPQEMRPEQPQAPDPMDPGYVGGEGSETAAEHGGALLETGMAMGSAAIAEPVSGLVGGLQAINPLSQPGSGAEMVGDVQEAMAYQPRTDMGKQYMEGMGEAAQPLVEAFETAEQASGDLGYDMFGPVGGALFSAAPTAVLEVLGVASLRKPLRAARGAKAKKQMFKEHLQNNPLVDQDGKVTTRGIQSIQRGIDEGLITADDASKVLTPEQLQRAQVFQRQGVEPTRANLTQGTDDFRLQQDASKRSGPVSEAVAGQEAQMINRVDEAAVDMGAAANDVVETNANTFKAVDNTVRELDSAVQSAYTAAREAAPGAKNVKYTNLTAKLRSLVGEEKISGGIISALRGELKNRGVLQRGWTPEGLTDIQTAEGIRQYLNSLHDPANPRGNVLIRQLKEALDEDVAAVVPEEIFEPAREARRKYATTVERAARDKRDVTRGSFLEDVINNKIPQEKIQQKLIGARDDDFLKFKQFLLEDSGESGVSAWKDIKAQTLRDAVDKATSTQGKAEGGQRVFNARLFANEFKNMRKSKKWDALFTPAEQGMIDDIIEIGKMRVPPRSVAQGSGPSGLAVDSAMKALMRKIPGLSDVVQGGVDTLQDRAVLSDPLAQTRKAATP